MVNCPFCNQEVSETARSCTHCGGWVDLNAKQVNSTVVRAADDLSEPASNLGARRAGIPLGLSLLGLAVAALLGLGAGSWLVFIVTLSLISPAIVLLHYRR